MNDLKIQNSAKVEFRVHLIIYLSIIGLLTIINLTVTPEYFWAKWPIMGWGVAIIIHGISAYYTSGEANLRNK